MRIVDIFFAGLALMILLPIFLIVSCLLKFTGEGEIFFRQERIGQHGVKFNILKFATMLKDSPRLGSGSITSKNDPRILPVGRYLRKSKLNELPQLINVLTGELSLIGPRPHVERDLAGIDEQTLKRILTLRPGLSGIGSIIFRNEESILQQFDDPRNFYDDNIAPFKGQLELWYYEQKRLSVYVLLIVLTILVVFGAKTSLVYKVFPSLPSVPPVLKKYIISGR